MTQVRGRGLPYVAALDGLRAVAVMTVVAYHASLERVPGGFFGVDVFFVISGYLVTALYLERASADALGDALTFWRRRMLRLLPAAIVAIAATWLVFVLLDVRSASDLTAEAAGALAYVANWFFLFRNQSYFETISQPSPFLHFWSLAVEAQFYLLWPLLLIAAMRFGGRLAAFALALSLAAISTVIVATLYDPGTDPSRAYYGTDARVAGLLLGAALAIVLRPGFAGRGVRLLVEGAGWTGIAVLIWMVTRVSEFDGFIYRGGFLLSSTATVGVMLAALHGRNSVARALSFGPLRWLGTRSYSIYLWHWPIFVLSQPQLSTELQSFGLLLARLGATLALAELSYRVVENRFRPGGDWRTLPRFRRTVPQIWHEPWMRPAGIVTAGLAAIVIAGGLPIRSGVASEYAALATTIEQQSSGADITITTAATTGVEASASTPPLQQPSLPDLPASMIVITPTVVPTATPSPAAPIATAPSAAASSIGAPAGTGGTGSDAAPSTATATPTSTETPAVTPTESSAPAAGTSTPAAGQPAVTMIGDSVMLGAKPAIEALLPGVVVDAEVGRQFRTAADLIAAYAAAGTLGDVIVLHLGANGPFTTAEFEAVMAAAGDRVVIFVNVTVPRRWESEVNDALSARVAEHPHARLADWHAISAGVLEYFGADGVHLTGTGQQAYAALIEEQVRAAR